MNSNKFYKITVLRAHNSKLISEPKATLTFYFEAKNLFEAITKAKSMPAVKRSRKDVVQYATEIDFNEYCIGRTRSAYVR